ncbi:MAG TPA: hypothetical protein VGU61_17105 [Noviherbaspirillum sp.]|jgi:hypothetical protein|uniref:hypothetical protein n=1 Tax=Noviherbaspirillum sp. TaxID=1926288 RepID=UPI002DDD3B4F|nr:hypothetical protein [Noviherbaspirillum sp.]HEV2611988.1 hypothetical protein [Noviherbaspirillum sp.]
MPTDKSALLDAGQSTWGGMWRIRHAASLVHVCAEGIGEGGKQFGAAVITLAEQCKIIAA